MHSIVRPSRKTAAAAALLGALLIPAAHAELVTNGGFNAGGLAGWTVSGGAAGSSCSYAVVGCSADIYSLNGELVSLSQTLGTVAGASYSYSFYVDYGVSNLVSFTADGADLFKLTNSADGVGMQKITGSFVAADASTTIAFNLSGQRVHLFLDEVSVLGPAPANNVPEPMTLVLAGIGLAALALSRGRRPSQTA